MAANLIFFILLLIVVLVTVLFLLFTISLISLWFQAKIAGSPIGLLNLVFMIFRKVPPKLIVENKIFLCKAGLDISTDFLECHFLAGGNVENVVKALIRAKDALVDLDYNRAAAIDLSGNDIVEIVESAIIPKEIILGSFNLRTEDNMDFKVGIKIVIRTLIERVIGGFDENEFSKRVYNKLSSILKNIPYDKLDNSIKNIRHQLLQSKLDAQCRFELMDITIKICGLI